MALAIAVLLLFTRLAYSFGDEEEESEATDLRCLADLQTLMDSILYNVSTGETECASTLPLERVRCFSHYCGIRIRSHCDNHTWPVTSRCSAQ